MTLQTLVDAGREEGLYPAAVYRVFAADGSVAAEGAAGLIQERRPAGFATLWDLASLTKPVVTATLALILAQEGCLHLDDEVARFLPGDRPNLAGITLRHCLCHVSGLRAWERLFSPPAAREEVLRRVFASERERAPRAGYAYSDLGYILLGEALARAGGAPLEVLAEERVFLPLGMRHTRFLPPARWRPRIAETWCPDRGRVLIGEVHDGNCAALGGIAGHAGLFGTLDDVTRYGRMLLNGGVLDGRRLLAPLAAGAMGENQNPAGLPGHTLGWFLRPNGFLPAGDLLPADTFGHTGFTGTSLLLCPSLGLGFALLTNRAAVDRDAGDFLRFRRRFHNAAAALAAGAGRSPTAS